MIVIRECNNLPTYLSVLKTLETFQNFEYQWCQKSPPLCYAVFKKLQEKYLAVRCLYIRRSDKSADVNKEINTIQ